jgi:hypothetical protein
MLPSGTRGQAARFTRACRSGEFRVRGQVPVCNITAMSGIRYASSMKMHAASYVVRGDADVGLNVSESSVRSDENVGGMGSSGSGQYRRLK